MRKALRDDPKAPLLYCREFTTQAFHLSSLKIIFRHFSQTECRERHKNMSYMTQKCAEIDIFHFSVDISFSRVFN